MNLKKKLNLLLEDLNSIGIISYLMSTHFKRLCINNDLCSIWEINYSLAYEEEYEGQYWAIRNKTELHNTEIDFDKYIILNEFDVYFNAFSKFLDSLLRDNFNDFQVNLNFIIIDFIQNTEIEFNLDNIIKDLNLLKFDPNLIEEIDRQFLIFNMRILNKKS
jgi:hypothetical protein